MDYPESPKVSIRVGEIFLCRNLINSPTRFARRGIKLRHMTKITCGIFGALYGTALWPLCPFKALFRKIKIE